MFRLGAVYAAIMPVRGNLDFHHFLVICAIIVHDGQQRNAMMRRRPKYTGSVHQVAVRLDVDGEASTRLIGQRGPNCGWRAISHPCATGASDVPVRFAYYLASERLSSADIGQEAIRTCQ